MTLGRQHTLTDHELARQRDDTLRARRDSLREPERIRLPDLGPGLHGPGGGTRSMQGRVDDGRQIGLLDQVVGGGFRLLVLEDSLPGVDVPALRAAGVTVVVIGELAGNGVVADVDGTLHHWFDQLGAAAIAERPDHYVLAAGPDANEVARSCWPAARGDRPAPGRCTPAWVGRRDRHRRRWTQGPESVLSRPQLNIGSRVRY